MFSSMIVIDQQFIKKNFKEAAQFFQRTQHYPTGTNNRNLNQMDSDTKFTLCIFPELLGDFHYCENMVVHLVEIYKHCLLAPYV